MSNKYKVSLDRNAPNSNAILGALLSGGDVMKLARMLAHVAEPTEESVDNKQEEQDATEK